MKFTVPNAQPKPVISRTICEDIVPSSNKYKTVKLERKNYLQLGYVCTSEFRLED